jgi:hypothetical protein
MAEESPQRQRTTASRFCVRWNLSSQFLKFSVDNYNSYFFIKCRNDR